MYVSFQGVDMESRSEIVSNGNLLYSRFHVCSFGWKETRIVLATMEHGQT